MSPSLEDDILGALAHVDGDSPADSIDALKALSEAHPGHVDIADAWASLGDSPPARGPFGVAVLQALVPIARDWPEPRGRSTMMMALAELELTHREATWAAHWIRKAIASDPSDVRPWDLLELMLDAHPGLPVGRATRQALVELRKAQGELPVNDEDFAGETFDEWDEPAPPA